MSIIYAAWSIVLLAVALFIVVLFVRNYRKHTGTAWQRTVQAFWDSETLLVQALLWVSVAIVNGLVAFAEFIHEPELATAIQQYLDPKVVSVIMVTSIALTTWARLRKASADPVR